MPFGYGKSAGKSPYKDLEHAPLSAQDDDDHNVTGMPLPAYSDNPTSPQRNNRSNGSTHKSSAILERNGTDNNDDRAQDDYDDDDGFGERDYFRGNTPTKNGRNKKSKYRGALIVAYLKYWFTCACFGRCISCCAEDSETRRTRRNIGSSSYGLLTEKSKRCRCTKRIFMGLFYFVLMMVILWCASAIGYIIARDGSPFVPDEASNTNGALNVNSNKLLPPPPDNLHDVCTDWITEAGRKKCKTECHVGLCCALPASDKGSCWEDQASECATYRSACMALELHSGGVLDDAEDDEIDDDGRWGHVPGSDGLTPLPDTTKLDAPKPSYLNGICSPDSLKSPDGFSQCSEVCRPSRCCHPETYGCKVASEDKQWCSAYEAPCANVAESWRGSGHVTAIASPSDNSGTGTASGGGPVSAPGESLPSQNNSVNNQVMLKCNSAELNPPDACIEACYLGACCYVSNSFPPIEQLFDAHYGRGKSPFATVETCADQVGFCQQFGSCEHLNHLVDTSGWHSDEVTYELDIGNVCKAEYIAQFGALECSNVCQPAHCCFSGEYQCEDVQLGHLDCKDYGACRVLYPSSVKSTAELFLMAQKIDEVCEEDLVDMPEGRANCQALCKDRLCCFEVGIYGCANDPSQNCIAYAGCETLVSTPKSYLGKNEKTTNTNVGTTTKNNDVDLGIDTFITALETACSENSLKTLEGIKQCHDKCQTHLCCFTSDPTLTGVGDCENAHVQACNAYKPCERLVTPQVGQPPQTNTAGEAFRDSLDVIAEKVAKACDLPPSPANIDDTWVTGCHSVCASRLCCHIDAKLGSNCLASVGTEECNAYSACEILVNENMGKEMDDKLVSCDIKAHCNIGVVQDSILYDECEDQCTERSCCFEDVEAYSCYGMEKDWCNEFESCKFVDFTFSTFSKGGSDSTWSSTPNSFVDNPAQKDDAYVMKSLKNRCTQSLLLENWEMCEDLCLDFECCFRNAASCVMSNNLEEDCDKDEIYICQEFFTTDEDDYYDTPAGGGSGLAGNKDSTSKSNSNTATQPNFDEFEASMEDACSPTALTTLKGIETCYDKCQAHLCCVPADALEKEFDCSDIYPDECSSYYACENLVSLYDLWKPPSTRYDRYAVKNAVDDACTLPSNSPVTEEWLAHCHQVCEARMCCHAHPSLGSNCADSLGVDECEDYAACKVLIGGDGRNSNSFDDVCTKEVSSNEDLFYDCEEACNKRSCCFEGESGLSCYKMEREWCNEYEACRLVGMAFTASATSAKTTPAGTPITTTETTSIDDLCNQNVSTNQHQYSESDCTEECTKRSCCFKDESGLSCYEQEREWCNEYEACRHIGMAFTASATSAKTTPAGTITAEPGLGTFKTLCKEPNIKKNWDTCEGLCSQYACCFTIENSCYENNVAECEEHYVCEEFFTGDQVGGNDAIPTTNTVSVPTISSNTVDMKQSFDTLCSQSKVHFNWETCKQHCSVFECCFDEINSCYEEHELECLKYYICEEFYDDEYNGSIEVLCSESNLAENGDICRDLCTDFECCFNGECSMQECSDYSLCEEVFKDKGEIVNSNTESLEAMQYRCSASHLVKHLDDCARWCVPYECCFYSSNSCYFANKQNCDDHDACRLVLEGTSAEP